MIEDPAIARSFRIIGVSVAGGMLLGLIVATLVVMPSGEWFMMLSAGPDLAAAFGIMSGMIGGVCASSKDHKH